MSNFTDSFLSANTGSFPSEQLPSLRERLSQLDDSQANQVIAAANVKNPTTALILSIFLGGFGVDRFYIGNTGLGIGKLLTTVLLAVITLGLSLSVTWIWVVVDWFLIINATKKANLVAINNALATMTVPSATTEANEG
ncbi:NINE protein [Streptococcus infantis]|uniref:TM2 domain-containing protein n=1 Tax=Streptococcus infantis TaxID=68892 RepID=UPI001F410A58|nr:TM2 domain-containing protein [Streptococcus infantis]UJD03087.1 NINE protein [Streptococcus infantis]